MMAQFTFIKKYTLRWIIIPVNFRFGPICNKHKIIPQCTVYLYLSINPQRMTTKHAKSAFRVGLQVINQSLIQRRNMHKMDSGRSSGIGYALGDNSGGVSRQQCRNRSSNLHNGLLDERFVRWLVIQLSRWPMCRAVITDCRINNFMPYGRASLRLIGC